MKDISIDRKLAEEIESDRIARERIVSDLDTNFLVEAGAGSGKTTSLVDRMLAHVLADRPVESLAAVTFTRKAASELAERFRERLEQRRRSADAEDNQCERALIESALDRIDGCFVGTIHAFCGRLLRERPLEADLDPSFVEITEDDWMALCANFWRDWVHRLTDEEDIDIATLRKLGVEPYKLSTPFRVITENQDVDFPVSESTAPDTAECRRLLRSLVQRLMALRPKEEPAAGWDKLQKLVWRLTYLDKGDAWDNSIARFCDAIAGVSDSSIGITQNRWSDDKTAKAHIKELHAEFAALHASHIVPLLRCWYEHRYGPIMRVLLRARADFERYRIRTGQLGFGDLLSRAVHLLVSDDDSRQELGERFRYLMVDEFQDTDPLQAEVCFLLASDSSEGSDWRSVRPRSGALFVVGDPKQSIYRFRRADIETYDLVKRRMTTFGAVVRLTRNFRSTPEIGDFVNDHFVNVFPADANEMQAPFSPLIPHKPKSERQSVSGYVVTSARSKEEIYEDDAARIASWISYRLQNEKDRKPEDFMILSWRRESVLGIARALAERNVPAIATGAAIGVEPEVEELLAVLRALADPANPVNVVAALQGMFIGASPADVFDAHVAGIKFSLLDDPGEKSGMIADGIRLLRKFRDTSLSAPPDSLIDTIVDKTGLLASTAGEEIGDTRAGMLLRIISMLRASAVESTGSLTDAIERIEAMLENDIEGEPTLRPGRSDAVRVMNLHQAKGLEAEIVVLSSPYKPRKLPPVDLHVNRAGNEKPTGWMQINVPTSQWDETLLTLGQPPAWDEKAALEAQYLEAERDRLRYVAATRAKQELWVAQLVGGTQGPGQWDSFTSSLPALPLVEFVISDAPGRAVLEDSVEDIVVRIADGETSRAAAARASYSFYSVTDAAKAAIVARADGESVRAIRQKFARGRGRAWGRAVHRVVEAMGRGRTGEGLRVFAQAVVSDEMAGVSDIERAEYFEEIVSLASALSQRDEWLELMRCNERYFELPVSEVSEQAGVQTITEGVIDAVGFDGGRWHVFDWKTDDCTESEWSQRAPAYQAQVDAYAQMLSDRYGHPATGVLVRP